MAVSAPDCTSDNQMLVSEQPKAKGNQFNPKKLYDSERFIILL